MKTSETHALHEKLAEAARQPTVMDVGEQRVAKVYAESLLNAATGKGVMLDVLGELDDLVNKVFDARPKFETFLASGAVGRKQKEALLLKTFSGRSSDIFLNFLLVLNHHERLDMVRGILDSAQELANERMGRMPVDVKSAVPLSDDQRERLINELREAFGREPLLKMQTDPDLLGGMVVRVGDWLYDASVRSQLLAIRNQIIERSSYEIQSGRDRFSSAN